MKKILMLSSVASMQYQFNMTNIRLLQEMGCEVHIACNFKVGNTCTDERIEEFKAELNRIGVKFFQIDFLRSVSSIGSHCKAYKQTLELIDNQKYDLIHCHTPIGGVVGRLAGKKMNIPVMYTAHGFHFFNGCPIMNRLIYKNIESCLSKYTDTLITINNEDYAAAKKFKAKRVRYIHGAGIDYDKFANCSADGKAIRKSLGIPDDAIVILSVGELNDNKNHCVIIKALGRLKRNNIHYIICGKGNNGDMLKSLNSAENGCTLHIVGFRDDVADIMKAADIFAFPSKREGLGFASLEAMASGLPLVTSDIHGINDYSINDVTGYKCDPENDLDFSVALEKLIDNEELRHRMGLYNRDAVKIFSSECSKREMAEIYSEVLNLEYAKMV